MSFDSIPYLIFLPAIWIIYLALSRQWQNVLLLLASYVFYGWWDVRFLFLIVISTVVDYCCGIMIARKSLSPGQYGTAALSLVLGFTGALLFPALLDMHQTGREIGSELWWIGLATVTVIAAGPYLQRVSRSLSEAASARLFLLLSLFTNLGLLGVFKYFDFFVSSAESMALSMGITDVELLHLNIVLPVGISFYTFQTLSYTLGIYRKELEPTTDFIGFSLFVAFFPQLVAGPIERASNLLPRLLSRRTITMEYLAQGSYLILLGLFKKIGIANGIAGSVDSVFNSTGDVSGLDVSVATFFFAIQIYCDFSGYSDIARGSAKLFGIDLMRNFEQPYFSRNPSEFWRRWHISLSSWLRDYLYISLGGNRAGVGRTYRNLMLTMLLGGLWHGAAWNFVLWGAYQGAILCVHRYFSRTRFAIGGSRSPIRHLLVVGGFFIVTCYGWLLFRATSLDQIVTFTSLIFTDFQLDLSVKRPTFSALLGLPALLLIDLYMHRTDDTRLRRLPNPLRGSAYAFLVMIVLMGLSNDPTQFIYFQF